MDNKYLMPAIALALFMGFMSGLYAGIPKTVDITVDTGENYKALIDVFNESIINDCMNENKQLWEAVNILTYNLDRSRDMEVFCIEELTDMVIPIRNGYYDENGILRN